MVLWPNVSLAANWPSRCSCRSEEHTSELQSRQYFVCRLLLEKKKQIIGERLQSRRIFTIEQYRRAVGKESLVHSFLDFFFNDTATTEIYTLSLHDALPI